MSDSLVITLNIFVIYVEMNSLYDIGDNEIYTSEIAVNFSISDC